MLWLFIVMVIVGPAIPADKQARTPVAKAVIQIRVAPRCAHLPVAPVAFYHAQSAHLFYLIHPFNLWFIFAADRQASMIIPMI